MNTLRIYQDTTGEYRWTLIARNGETIADSGESYTRREDAERAARNVLETTDNATIEEAP